MKTVTIFSWGFWGWGSSTPELIASVDAIERKRGFRPPLFVEVRIQRVGRATGFISPAFEKLLGEKRYIWMRSLGNRRIQSGTGPKIQIADPGAAGDLLDLALKAAEKNRRIIYFCGCKFPKCKGTQCHRATVTKLLLEEAKRRKARVNLVEWPGGKPVSLKLEVSEKTFSSMAKGAWHIPVEKRLTPRAVDAPPWGTIATFSCGKKRLHRIVGSLIWRRSEWQLRVLYQDDDLSLAELRSIVPSILDDYGLAAFRRSGA